MITYRRFGHVASLALGLVLASSTAAAQEWGARRGTPPGRVVRVEQARARPCPPGHAKKGWCNSRYEGRRDRRDWCWDRNHDARCDRVNERIVRRPSVVDRRDGRIYRRDDRRDGRYDGRVVRDTDRGGSLRDALEVLAGQVYGAQGGRP